MSMDMRGATRLPLPEVAPAAAAAVPALPLTAAVEEAEEEGAAALRCGGV